MYSECLGLSVVYSERFICWRWILNEATEQGEPWEKWDLEDTELLSAWWKVIYHPGG